MLKPVLNTLFLSALLCLIFAGSQALAQSRDRHGHDSRQAPHPSQHIRRIPEHSREIHVNRSPYFYHAGIYYAPRRGGFDLVRAPIGAWVQVLPRGYHRVRVGLNLYYVFNSDYYRWDPARRVYVVVEEPRDADKSVDVPADNAAGNDAEPPGEMIFYPKQGQSEEQLSKDRYECHLWAYDQSGFDPSLATPDQEGTPGDYRRAMSACMEGRNYVVK